MSKKTDPQLERLDDTNLHRAVIEAHGWDGLTISTTNGHPATLAVIDTTTGKIIESGPDLVEEVWDATIEAYRRKLVGKKALRVTATPQGVYVERESN